MGGIAYVDEVLRIDRDPNELDRLAISFSKILRDLAIDHVFVSGYVAILAGRSRATEDVDVLLERLDDHQVEALVDRLQSAGFWGPAMPLASMQDMLEDSIWVAWADEIVPHLDVRFIDDQVDQHSLDHAIEARIGDVHLPIGPIEVQIAYKLSLGALHDVEDAYHLWITLGDSLEQDVLDRWLDRLDVQEEFDALRR